MNNEQNANYEKNLKHVPKEYRNYLPEFAKIIFMFDLKNIDNFINKFLLDYIDDDNLKKETEGLFVLFVKNVYKGIYSDEEVNEVNAPGHYKLIFEITEHHKDVYLLMQVNVDVGSIYNSTSPNIYVNFIHNGEKFEEHRLIDTGATYSTIPFIEDWNYVKNNYNGNNKYTKYLSTNIEKIKPIPIKTANGNNLYNQITWKNKIKVSIGNLPSLELNNSLLPLTRVNDLYIIGQDILYYYNIHIMTVNNKITFTILPSENLSREEEQNNSLNKILTTTSKFLNLKEMSEG